MPTSTVENYLKCILRLDEDSHLDVTVGAIASDLGVTPGTVSTMMRHLDEEGLIDYVPRKSVQLLPAGRQQALRVVRRHRLIETFLVTVMKLDWSEVHEEAEILEHVISDRLLRRMDEMLGYPSQDPHGDPIPDDTGHMADQPAQPLRDIAGGRFVIVRVNDSEPRFLDWLRHHQLLPGAEVELQRRDEVAGVLELVVLPEHETARISEGAAAGILVQPVS